MLGQGPIIYKEDAKSRETIKPLLKIEASTSAHYMKQKNIPDKLEVAESSALNKMGNTAMSKPIKHGTSICSMYDVEHCNLVKEPDFDMEKI